MPRATVPRWTDTVPDTVHRHAHNTQAEMVAAHSSIHDHTKTQHEHRGVAYLILFSPRQRLRHIKLPGIHVTAQPPAGKGKWSQLACEGHQASGWDTRRARRPV